MILKIKNMASSRCKTFVQEEMNKLGVYNITVELGEVELSEKLPEEKLRLLDIALRSAGLELLEDKKHHLAEKIKTAIHDLVYHTDDIPKPNYSDFISQKINLSYTSLSNTFSKTQGKTIEKYIIEQRIERVKELLIYTDLSLDDMAFKLHYSSVAHLSNQFKKFTGITPSFFRKLRNPKIKKATVENNDSLFL
ncbi:MAG: AraC family transcriptional regulator [Firmicutes bacterium ML8_F2]|jgi:AraC-like DNA-binding protein|nr:MAG: AraC family transcriptional regulator [Firmicutes bacterium ML8_F2]